MGARTWTMFLNSEISFLPQAVDQEFGKVPPMAMATDMGPCQGRAHAPFLCSPLPAPTGLQVILNLVAAAVALHAIDRLVLV